jgi:hypothetical protein
MAAGLSFLNRVHHLLSNRSETSLKKRRYNSALNSALKSVLIASCFGFATFNVANVAADTADHAMDRIDSRDMSAMTVSDDHPVMRDKGYDFPYAGDPNFATMSPLVIFPKSVPHKVIKISSLPGRDKTAQFEKLDKTRAFSYIQDHPAPLVFLIPGFSGSPEERLNRWLAVLMYKAGYSVIVVPSPLNWHFALSQSESGLPGYTPEDARDLMRVMKEAYDRTVSQHHLQATEIKITGYSLGALEIPYLVQLDQQLGYFHFTRALLVNPPIHIANAMAVLDADYDLGKTLRASRRKHLMAYLTKQGIKIALRAFNNPMIIRSLRKFWRISVDESRFAIGQAFRQEFASTLEVTQQLHDSGVLTQPVERATGGPRYDEAQKFPFQRYLNDLIYPYWSQRLHFTGTPAELVASADFVTMKPMLASNSIFRMQHNLDDILNDPSEMMDIANALGSRAVIYPSGGHLGNVWMQQNQDDFIALLK